MALATALAAACVADTIATRDPPRWVSAGLVAALVATALRARRRGRTPATLARERDEWYLDRDPAAGRARGRAADEPLELLRPRYRSAWLLVLEFRDGTGRVRELEVWADAVAPADFSYLHLACLFDATDPRARPAADRPR